MVKIVDYNWNGGAGGIPILSQPIARPGQFPLGEYRKTSWADLVAIPVLLFAIPIVLVMAAMGRLK